MPIYKPSAVILDMPPLTATFGHSEEECAGALLIWTLSKDGDEWKFISLKRMGELMQEAITAKPVPNPIAWWVTNPFFHPDFESLVKHGFIEKQETEGEPSFGFMEKAFEKIEKWVPHVWTIEVAGWGSTQMVALEYEAEAFRHHKANFEHGVGKKTRLTGATPQELERYRAEGPHHLE